LRYFNVAGADPEGFIGESHNPETHLIPLLLQVASGRKDFVEIYGNDYPTHDGTCIRDYIHVVDICEAHIAALNWIVNFNKSGSFNLGNKQGYSVREIINACVKVTGKDIKHKFTNRRVGDPAVLVADASLANKMMGFMPKYNDIETIIEHSWLWEKKNYM
jgi:UDP-glucose 4-epimerase